MESGLAATIERRDPGGPEAGLPAVLMDSRQRWRGLTQLATDIAFETDANGRLVFICPDGALGWPDLVGRPAASLLATPDSGVDPFRPSAAVRRLPVWLRTESGAAALFAITTTSLPGGGLRGVGVDLSAEDGAARVLADTLRRASMLDDIVGAMRRELHMPRMVGAVLDAAARALGASGAAVLTYADAVAVLHATGAVPPPVAELAARMLNAGQTCAAAPACAVLACVVPARFGEMSGLVFWREPAPRVWEPDACALAESLTGVVRVVLEQDRVQHEMARQARTDPLTGLLNRRAFAVELERRLQRLHGRREMAVLLYLDLDCFKTVNDQLGHEAGDAALLAVTAELRRVFRPADLVARLGGDEFAVWMDGADEMTAAERAEDLRCSVPRAIAGVLPPDAPGVTMSIGIVRRSGTDIEEVDQLIRRADQAMYYAKRTGRDRWHVTAEAAC